MDERRVEELLRERDRSLRGALASPEFAARALTALRRERARPRLRLLGGVALLAAAAALALVVLWRGPQRAVSSGVTLEVALLDADGRELVEDGGVRGPDGTLPPPALVRLELVAPASGFARVFLYDARGRLREDAEVALAAGASALVSFALDGAWETSGGKPVLSWVIAGSSAPFEAAALGLPAQLEAATGPERRAELELAGRRAAEAGGCAVEVRHLE